MREFSEVTGLGIGYVSLIENAKRPPTRAVAEACDRAFPERGGWFSDWYAESRTWSEIPAAFRSWAEHEESAQGLRIWQPSILHGLLQSEGYARSLLSASAGATADMVSERTAARMERQRRLFGRADPPEVLFLVDELSLYRCVGSADVMAGQCRHLLEVATLPHVVMQVVPPVGHPGGASGLIVADTAAYCEHVAAGYVLEEPATMASMVRLLDTIRSEALPASHTARITERMAQAWTGGNPLTAPLTAGIA